VVVTDNVCSDNQKGSGIQLVSSSHVLVQGNTCFGNRNGIGLFSDADVTDPGHHVIGINLLYHNEFDVRHQRSDRGQPLTGVRIHGLHGEPEPEGTSKPNRGRSTSGTKTIRVRSMSKRPAARRPDGHAQSLKRGRRH
jgi:parallel beta-helix repeat protein